LIEVRSLLRRAPWLRTKRPAHAFVLGRTRLTYVGPEKPGRSVSGTPPAVRAVAATLPEDAFADAAAGAPVAGAAFTGAVSRLIAEAGVKLPAASLVVPDEFVRVLVVEVEEPERRGREIEEILSWKFGRTFGEPVPPLRLSWRPAGPGASGTRVLALAVPEEAAVSWEAPFEKAGVRIGAVEIESLAVSSLGAAAVAGEGFVVWARGTTATVAHFEKGSLRFLRVRSTADALAALQELRLTASYVAPPASPETPPDDGDSPLARIPCAAGPADSPVVEALTAFRAEHGGPPPMPLSLGALLPGTRVASGRAEGAELLAALGAMAGGD
jgi:hypothetical protein